MKLLFKILIICFCLGIIAFTVFHIFRSKSYSNYKPIQGYYELAVMNIDKANTVEYSKAYATNEASLDESVQADSVSGHEYYYILDEYGYEHSLPYPIQDYLYDKMCKYGIENYFDVYISVIWCEFNFEYDEISSTNDYGLCQINKGNFRWLQNELGITDFLDPYQNIDAGIFVFNLALEKENYDVERALVCYNMGSAKYASTRYSRNVLNTLQNKLHNYT